jgi:aldehyde:ferredoxin oxidoreductase
MAGYHSGPAAYLTNLTGSRHSHLDSAGYALDEKAAKGEALTPEGIGSALLQEERWRQVLSSLVVCYFARGVYDGETIQQALAVAGFEVSAADLSALGAETLRRKYAFKQRAGFDLVNQRIPKRILETPSPLGLLDEAYLRRSMELFQAGI